MLKEAGENSSVSLEPWHVELSFFHSLLFELIDLPFHSGLPRFGVHRRDRYYDVRQVMLPIVITYFSPEIDDYKNRTSDFQFFPSAQTMTHHNTSHLITFRHQRGTGVHSGIPSAYTRIFEIYSAMNSVFGNADLGEHACRPNQL